MGTDVARLGATFGGLAPLMLWGGRFDHRPHGDLLRLSASIEVDRRLLPQDVAATKAHARTLVSAGLLPGDVLPQIDECLDELVSEHAAGTLEIRAEDEDVHSLVERRLTERLGETGKRIHAGRSRNDLVATDLRLWCMAAALELAKTAGAVVSTLCDRAEEHLDTLMPGYTHLQRAQPVTVGFHLCAHGFALARDAQRFVAAHDAASTSPLGAGALAGSSLGLDPEVAARALGLDSVFDNAMDAVSDRDFACELLFACALCCIHLSRLGEEIVLWTSSEFSFARLADEWSTGSSMMPQKRNPDVAELVRGRAGRSLGDLMGLMGVLKGLPLAYDRDLQEDKEPVFSSVDRTRSCLKAVSHLVRALSFDEGVLARAAGGGAAWATDVAEALVRRGVPFREAHEGAGRLVAALERRGAGLAEATPEELQAAHPRLEEEDRQLADPRAGVSARSGRGGPAPEEVARQIGELRAAATALL